MFRSASTKLGERTTCLKARSMKERKIIQHNMKKHYTILAILISRLCVLLSHKRVSHSLFQEHILHWKEDVHNSPFLNYLEPRSQSESWCPSFHMNMRFIHMQIIHIFHTNGCEARLALIKRLRATRKYKLLYKIISRGNFTFCLGLLNTMLSSFVVTRLSSK